ncbi:MAG TPA: LytR C-terminal domain-containing protein [Candidatus Levybacteria bacterium]|nr:LytR C-terminal domain-containing protein [Candidatus Levybacteria bacterium]
MAEKTVPPFQSYASRSTNHTPRTPGKALYVVLFLLLILIIGIGTAQFLSSRNNDLKDAAPTAIEFDEPTDIPPSPTPEEIHTTITPTDTDDEPSDSVDKASGLDRADLSVVILNGSGVSGAAGKLSTKLKSLGYDVTSTGNADTSDYESTVIEVSSTKKNFLNLLKKDLGSDYTIGESTSTYTGTGDARIIIGAE